MYLIWTEDAAADYHQHIDYLLERRSAQVAKEFIEEVEHILDLILVHPLMYPASDYRNVRKAVIRKQVSLFYQIDGKKIVLLRFWNNYQSPGRLKL